MARRYVIRKNDTLAKIARRFYADAGLHRKLASYNGILDPDLILVGQTIEIPARRELEGGAVAGPAPMVPPPGGAPLPVTPDGLEEILTTFGNIFEFIREDGNLDPRWHAEFLAHAPLPFSIPLSWDRSKVVSRLYCHTQLKEVFPVVFADIQAQGLQPEIRTFGGCFNFRSKRTSGKLSTHCWGIAIDLNPETNAQGAVGDMHSGVVEIFGRFGFKWGGDWSGRSKDPMHFQFCTGY